MHASAMNVEEIRNDVYRQVGRNVLIYQDIERVLKVFVIFFSSYAGNPKDIQRTIEERRLRFAKQTLGSTALQFLDEFFCSKGSEDHTLEGGAESIWISFKTSFQGPDILKKYQDRLGATVDARNDLVHHFLENCDLGSAEQLEAASIQLDRDRETAVALRTSLLQLIEGVQAFQICALNYLSSPEVRKEILTPPQGFNAIVAALKDIATTHARADGWTLLSVAGQELAKRGLEHRQAIERIDGNRTLQQLVEASNAFDLLIESLPNGNSRSVYRPRVGIQFEGHRQLAVTPNPTATR